MKSLTRKILIFTWVFVIFTLPSAWSQTTPSTKISYHVDSGPVFPIEGESLQMIGKLGLGDNSGEIQSLSFSVPLTSFIGSYGGYLAWLGNARRNPEMSFKSNSITHKNARLEVNGQLEFRKRFRPITVYVTREDTGNEIVLIGDFKMSTSDYFLGHTPSDLVAPWIPFQFTMIFDKPDTPDKGELLSSH